MHGEIKVSKKEFELNLEKLHERKQKSMFE